MSVNTAMQIVVRIKDFEERIARRWGGGEVGDDFFPERKFLIRSIVRRSARPGWKERDDILHYIKRICRSEISIQIAGKV